MSPNTSVALGAHFVSFIDAQVQGGRYGTASDVVRAGLRHLLEYPDHFDVIRVLHQSQDAERHF